MGAHSRRGRRPSTVAMRATSHGTGYETKSTERSAARGTYRDRHDVSAGRGACRGQKRGMGKCKLASGDSFGPHRCELLTTQHHVGRHPAAFTLRRINRPAAAAAATALPSLPPVVRANIHCAPPAASLAGKRGSAYGARRTSSPSPSPTGASGTSPPRSTRALCIQPGTHATPLHCRCATTAPRPLCPRPLEPLDADTLTPRQTVAGRLAS